MKKLITLTIATLGLILIACKDEKQNNSNEKKEKITSDQSYDISKAKHTIQWTAYKTTAKTPVSGTFKTLNITSSKQGNSIKEAFNEAQFEIPINSIFSKDTVRDNKLQNFFFNTMANTSLISGKLTLETDTKGYLEITMNNTTHKLPINYNIKNNTFTLEGVMNLKDWNANNALTKLHEACLDLHKGEDGISKTWDEVGISLKSEF